jgi:hypothetical protein
MKTPKILASLALAAAIVGYTLPSFATSWLDFSQSTGSVNITSANFNSATPLNRVVVVCPANGYLVATANAGFTYTALALPGKGWIRYSIAIDGAAPFPIDPNHYRNLQDYQFAANHSSPGGMFRVDRCQQGQQITYVFLAQRVQALTASAWQPRLAVEFFNVII